jgi:hypothetical protein
MLDSRNEFISYDLLALGQALDTSWGRSSTPKSSSYSVKFKLDNNVLTASYAAIVNFGTEREMIEMKRRYSEESIKHINNEINLIKSTYKDLAGRALKISELSSGESVEIIGYGVHNPKRTAYFRRQTKFELG